MRCETFQYTVLHERDSTLYRSPKVFVLLPPVKRNKLEEGDIWGAIMLAVTAC